jgi:hypothetical protein
MKLERLAYLVHYIRYHNYVNYIATPQSSRTVRRRSPLVFIWLCSSAFLVTLLRLVAWLEKIRREIGVIFSSLKDSEL